MGLQRAMHARTLICMGMRRNWDRPHDPKPIIARKGSALLANAHEDFARAMPRVNRLSKSAYQGIGYNPALTVLWK